MLVGIVIHTDTEGLILVLFVLVGRDTADVGSFQFGGMRCKVLKNLFRNLGTILAGHGVVHQNQLETSASLGILALHYIESLITI